MTQSDFFSRLRAAGITEVSLMIDQTDNGIIGRARSRKPNHEVNLLRPNGTPATVTAELYYALLARVKGNK